MNVNRLKSLVQLYKIVILVLKNPAAICHFQEIDLNLKTQRNGKTKDISGKYQQKENEYRNNNIGQNRL